MEDFIYIIKEKLLQTWMNDKKKMNFKHFKMKDHWKDEFDKKINGIINSTRVRSS